ncbi:hypothetical protein BS47DRAFT_1391789 [Hydnum rufescens UP504]|uniref:Uncharacterized protein n=1 Tax=Hydnum rufescens UP504 TaxID=1448309 RepID=A0A9P6DY35_9AGAM|nr:hypothetical protein BS47DRAFT_1391789 [Hydnum rufescens UP504]
MSLGECTASHSVPETLVADRFSSEAGAADAQVQTSLDSDGTGMASFLCEASIQRGARIGHYKQWKIIDEVKGSGRKGNAWVGMMYMNSAACTLAIPSPTLGSNPPEVAPLRLGLRFSRPRMFSPVLFLDSLPIHHRLLEFSSVVNGFQQMSASKTNKMSRDTAASPP